MDESDDKRFELRIGDAFPANSVLAQWALSLSLAMNDVGLVNHRLISSLQAGGDPSHHMHDVRHATSQVWEICEFLRETRGLPEVAEFLESLDKHEAMEALDRAVAAVAPGGRLAAQLATARNHVWHYPRPGSKVLVRALEACGDRDSELITGRGLARTRALYADEVAVQFFSPGGDVSAEEFKEFIVGTRDALSDLITFAGVALGSYLGRTGALSPIDQ